MTFICRPIYWVGSSTFDSSRTSLNLASLLDTDFGPILRIGNYYNLAGRNPSSDTKCQNRERRLRRSSKYKAISFILSVLTTCNYTPGLGFSGVSQSTHFSKCRLSTNVYPQYSKRLKNRPFALEPGPIIIPQMPTNLTHPAVKVLNWITNLHNDDLSDELDLCGLQFPIRVLTYTPAAVLPKCKSNELTTTQTHSIAVGHQCSMNAPGLLEVLPGRLFYFYIPSLRAKPASLLEFMEAASLLNAPTCILLSKDFDQHM